jgi:hypothetical protein
MMHLRGACDLLSARHQLHAGSWWRSLSTGGCVRSCHCLLQGRCRCQRVACPRLLPPSSRTAQRLCRSWPRALLFCQSHLQSLVRRYCNSDHDANISKLLIHAGISSVDGGVTAEMSVLMLPSLCFAQAVLHFEGGEAAGLRRLQQYIWDSDAVAHYADTRNGMARRPSWRSFPMHGSQTQQN